MKSTILIFNFLLLISINCEKCHSNSNITDEECFNRVLYFDIDNKSYRAGHFAMNTKGDMIIEYSYENYRLFYGLKKNGKYFFHNETKEIAITSSTININSLGRYESINSFVSLMDDINKEKEYLLSISTYITVLELHDLENNTYEISESASFFNQTEGIYSYIFLIIKLYIL